MPELVLEVLYGLYLILVNMNYLNIILILILISAVIVAIFLIFGIRKKESLRMKILLALTIIWCSVATFVSIVYFAKIFDHFNLDLDDLFLLMGISFCGALSSLGSYYNLKLKAETNKNQLFNGNDPTESDIFR